MNRKEFAVTLAISAMLHSVWYVTLAIWLMGGTDAMGPGDRFGLVLFWFLIVPFLSYGTTAFMNWVFSE